MNGKNTKSVERFALQVFLVCMVLCALASIGLIFSGFFDFYLSAEFILFPIAATLFIIGLAGFLIWLPIITYRLLEALQSPKE